MVIRDAPLYTAGPPNSNLVSDPVRQELDSALMKVLGVDRDLTDLRELLVAEPLFASSMPPKTKTAKLALSPLEDDDEEE